MAENGYPAEKAWLKFYDLGWSKKGDLLSISTFPFFFIKLYFCLLESTKRIFVFEEAFSSFSS